MVQYFASVTVTFVSRDPESLVSGKSLQQLLLSGDYSCTSFATTIDDFVTKYRDKS